MYMSCDLKIGDKKITYVTYFINLQNESITIFKVVFIDFKDDHII